MMKTKFTKGPWHIASKCYINSSVPTGYVAFIPPDHEDIRGNLSLIAAAPEMYDQGEKSIQDFYAIARRLDYLQFNDMARECEAFAEHIKAILKKARGE